MIELGNQAHGYAIAEAAGCLLNPAYDVVISRSSGEKLLGGVIFYDYTGRSIAVHVAGFAPIWMNRDILWVTFDYAFRQLKCSSVLSAIRSSNSKALAFNLRLGFKEVAIIPEVYPDGDMVITRLRGEDCKWLNIRPRTLQAGRHGR